MQLGKSIKAGALFVLLVCPDGIAAAITGLVLELLYRVSVHVKYLEPGYEYFSAFAGAGALVALLAARVVRYWFRQRKSANSPDIRDR